ncbi:Gibberellin regulated protein, partial [Dioscorea alata]
VEVTLVRAGSSYFPLGGEGSVPPEQCPAKCDYRCSATQHRKPCLFFCNKCCDKCHCVPSGTYGNKQECPCYDNWKTQDGKPKCP